MFERQDPNELRLDPVTGGQARMVGWYFFAGSTAPSTNGAVTVSPGTGISTSPITDTIASYPNPVLVGRTYTAGATVTGLTLICLQWISEDGEAGDRVYGWGWEGRRATVTAEAPPGAYGCVVNLFVPVVELVGDPDPVTGAQAVTYYAPAAWHDAPGVFLASNTPGDPVTITGAILVQGLSDPGALPPLPVDTTLGTRWYSELPELYRNADTDGLLRRFLKGWAEPLDTVVDLGARLADGELTDPVRADDQWVPWLAEALGVPVKPSFSETRDLLLSRGVAPSVGTGAALAALAQTWLTGSKYADAYPDPDTPWTIIVRVRTDELGALGDDPDELRRLMQASGQTPAGFAITVSTSQQTWAQIDAVASTWSDLDTGGPSWAVIDAIGLP